ncbi:TPA: tail fiber assembly protein [Morganella morganii]|uniref:tail fiber assembly protein n=1 Tax=Morganella morganii TaxID=582 RepID=UPI000C7AEFA3|nr:tail fiber assembly protein [Morganella morganii]PLA31926.1 tail fiber assembly protein [Morganella morganii]HCR4430858.1 tail fiber assembly protein [Morganella morganii]
MNYLYSPKTNSFYATSLSDEYDSAGTLPDDAFTVDDSIYIEYSRKSPAGKIRVANKNGLPAWGDIPPPTNEEQIAEAEAKKQALIAKAMQKTQLWQTQLILGIITEEDKASLKEWMLYVQQVQAVDSSLGAGVVWPIPPASPAR